MVKLTDVREGQTVVVCDFAAGQGLEGKLQRYGLFRGDRLRLVRSAPLRGPLLVELEGRELALGRGMAEKILVEMDS